jgi:hypothetical protein
MFIIKHLINQAHEAVCALTMWQFLRWPINPLPFMEQERPPPPPRSQTARHWSISCVIWTLSTSTHFTSLRISFRHVLRLRCCKHVWTLPRTLHAAPSSSPFIWSQQQHLVQRTNYEAPHCAVFSSLLWRHPARFTCPTQSPVLKHSAPT